PSEYVAYPDSMKRLTPTEVVCYPTNAAPAPKAVAPVVQVAAPAPVQVDLSSTGLTMIETDPNKAATVVAPAPASQDRAPRRRQRPREVYTAENNEPLVMVETQPK
ncbi:MAG: ribonuclease E/G, partial [Sideroxydans sp.]